MRLEADHVPAWLMARGLLDAQEATAPGFRVEDRSRRNRNFRVTIPGRAGLLVKQAKAPPSGKEPDKVAAEATVLGAIARDPAFAPARRFAPAARAFDEAEGALVVELVAPAATLTNLHINYGRVAFPPEMGAQAGEALAAFHLAGAASRLDLPDPGTHAALRVRAMVEAAAREDRVARAFTAAAQDVPAFRDTHALHELWRAHAAFVHGDARWDNWLVAPSLEPGGPPSLRLVDWEFAGRGDPAYDVAAYLAEHVRFALLAASARGWREEASLEEAAYPPSLAHASAGAFLAAYLRVAGAEREPLMRRARAYLPACLVLLAWEIAVAAREERPPRAAAEALRLAASFDAPQAREAWLGFA